jgi:hypothetical protein
MSKESKFSILERLKNRDSKKVVPCGFTMTFENKNTIIIQFGYGNECENFEESASSSYDAEIFICNENGEWYEFTGSSSKYSLGCLTTDEVYEWIVFAKTKKF